MAKLVGVTLGPKGRNVVLQNKYGPPKIVNDGETVLKQVSLPFLIITRNFKKMQHSIICIQFKFENLPYYCYRLTRSGCRSFEIIYIWA